MHIETNDETDVFTNKKVKTRHFNLVKREQEAVVSSDRTGLHTCGINYIFFIKIEMMTS